MGCELLLKWDNLVEFVIQHNKKRKRFTIYRKNN